MKKAEPKTSKSVSSKRVTKSTAKKTAKAAGKPAKLTKRERDKLRKMLQKQRAQLSGQISSLKRASLTRDDNVNSSEDGTDAFYRQFALTIASSESNSLVEIEEALVRLDKGSYGVCEGCECIIGGARLAALPFVRLCIKCQSEIENGQSGSRTGRARLRV